MVVLRDNSQKPLLLHGKGGGGFSGKQRQGRRRLLPAARAARAATAASAARAAARAARAAASKRDRAEWHGGMMQ